MDDKTLSVDERLIRLLETTIKDDRRLMRAVVQATTVEELEKARELMAERIRE